MSKLIFCLLFLPFIVNAQSERFNDFQVTIRLNGNGDVEVTERIRVTANGNEVKRGITRPLRRKKIGEDGERGTVDYKIISATRDGASEGFHTENKGGFRTVYLGRKDIKLDPGTYNYELRYNSNDQIYFTENKNELRWSVFSSDLRLPVDAAAVSLEVPSGIDVLSTACYTGNQGSGDQSHCDVIRSGNTLTFTLNQPLSAGEGLTIAAGFPSGSFYQPPPPPPPSPLQQNGSLWFSLLGILTGLAYGYTSWQKYGIDPPSPEVVHQPSPPRGLSPASISYINTGYAGQSQLTASLTALAVKGYLKIEEEKRSGFLTNSEIFIIRPQEKQVTDGLPAEQAVLYAQLLDAGDIELNGEFDERLQAATTAHSDSLSAQHKSFLKQGSNGWKILYFFLIMLVTVVASALFVSMASKAGVVAFGAAIMILVVGTSVFAWLIQQPSEDKVALWAEIKEMQQYLKLSEEKRRAVPNAPKMTEDYFQSILPYAIALGIENNWAADLASDVANTLQQNHHHNGLHRAPYLMSGFGSKMNTAYHNVASPPSSGGGGGGFSGGGGGVSGGGGGSGGW